MSPMIPEAALMYIGMTRAIEYLMISYSAESKYTKYFEKILAEKEKSKKTLKVVHT